MIENGNDKARSIDIIIKSFSLNGIVDAKNPPMPMPNIAMDKARNI